MANCIEIIELNQQVTDFPIKESDSTVCFLKQLDPSPNATFNIEHYTDLPKGQPKPKPDPLGGRYPNLTYPEVEALLPNLQAINEKGAGIFVARNQCSGHRNEQNVCRVRGVHADMDGISAEQLDAVTAILQPSIVVQSSSPGRYQLYWQLSEDEVLAKEETKAINQCLAEHHGADVAAVDVARLLRLPGFKHMKYRSEGKTPTVTATYHSRTYTSVEIRQAFPPIPTKRVAAKSRSKIKPLPYAPAVLSDQLQQVGTSISAMYPQLWAGDWVKAIRSSGEIGYPSKSEADLALAGHIARACQSFGVDPAALEGSVEAVFSSSPMGLSDKWQDRDYYRTRTIGKALSSTFSVSASSTHYGLQLESHGDIRNAKAFAQVARGQFQYVATRDCWIQWLKEKWNVCEKDEHIGMAKDVCGRILTAAGSVFGQDQERGKRMLQEAMAAHNLSRITAMLKLTVSEPDMAITDRELD